VDKALALVTAKQSTWTRHDLLKQLAWAADRIISG